MALTLEQMIAQVCKACPELGLLGLLWLEESRVNPPGWVDKTEWDTFITEKQDKIEEVLR